MKESGYDQKVNETVSVVATKTTEIGHKTWGIMRGVMALATQKVEEYTKEGMSWKADDWQPKESEKNGYYQEFGQDNKGWNSHQENSNKHYNSTSSWDDWDEKERGEEPRKGTQSSESWAGWDDEKDDNRYDNYHHSSSKKGETQNGKSGSLWSDGGFL